LPRRIGSAEECREILLALVKAHVPHPRGSWTQGTSDLHVAVGVKMLQRLRCSSPTSKSSLRQEGALGDLPRKGKENLFPLQNNSALVGSSAGAWHFILLV